MKLNTGKFTGKLLKKFSKQFYNKTSIEKILKRKSETGTVDKNY